MTKINYHTIQYRKRMHKDKNFELNIIYSSGLLIWEVTFFEYQRTKHQSNININIYIINNII